MLKASYIANARLAWTKNELLSWVTNCILGYSLARTQQPGIEESLQLLLEFHITLSPT